MQMTTQTDALYAERIVWGPAYPLAVVIAATGVVQLFDRWYLGTVCLGAAVLVIWFCVARYTVTGGGVEVLIGAGRPRIRVPTEDIESVGPTNLSLRTTGGWGYRGSWTLLRGVAISLGGQGAVQIKTRRGKKLRLASRHPNELLAAIESLGREPLTDRSAGAPDP